MCLFKRVIVVGLFLVSTSCSLLTQINPERAAATRLAQRKWSAAESSLRKALRKDTLNAEAKFIYAQYFLSPGNPSFDVDSAHAYIRRAQAAWSESPVRQRERLQKLAIDSSAMAEFQLKVDSGGFSRALQLNTQASYDEFLIQFPNAAQVSKARELRDELAYVDALKTNTVAGFRDYVESFPESHRVKEAEERYQLLLYEERTRSGRLEDYKAFLKDFPTSMFRPEAERLIFEASTSSGRIEDYIHYITEYPQGPQNSRARNILYYLMKESDVPRPDAFDTDSLRYLDERNKGYWVPFYKNGLYGFMNDDGVEVMEPQFESIDSTYLCGDIRTDFLVTSQGVYSRNGVRLLKSTLTNARELGFGFLLISDQGCKKVVHQSGFQIGPDCSEDARIIADQFVAVRGTNGWNLYAFNHRLLLPNNYEDISYVDKVIILKRYGKYIVVPASAVAAVADTRRLDESHVFDDVRSWGEGKLWVKNGVLEGVIDQDLGFVIPLDRQFLTKTSFGFTRKKDGRLQATGILSALEANTYEDIRDYGDWLELRNARSSMLYRVSQKKVVATSLDSVWIKNKVAFGVRGDSLNVYAATGRLASFERSSPVNFIPGSDTVVYFWVQEKKVRVVYEANQGTKLFAAEFETIETIGGNLFVFTKKNRKGALKKGVYRRDGKVAQPAEFDEIISTRNGYLSLLKEKKFGLYDSRRQRLIKPEYERNILPYSGNYFVAYKSGYGLITGTEEPVSDFEFDEIRYWNDTSALVRKNQSWSVYSIRDRSFPVSRIRSLQTIQDGDKEKVYRIQQENHYGILSTARGMIIPATFSDVINVGSSEKPFYFTEKRVEEAGIYVVIYYNSQGKFVRKQVYEEQEYEKIYCDN